MRALLFFACLLAAPALAQDGAAYNLAAKQYQPPPLSLFGGHDNPESLAAVGPLLHGANEQTLKQIKQLAESGNVYAQLLAGEAYRGKTDFRVKDISTALHLYQLAAARGSGEASERIAEMLDKQEITAAVAGGNAYHWRSLARQQGWIEQRLTVFCYDWITGRKGCTA